MIVSVVIPTHNGRHFLGPCLSALQRTKLPPDTELEVIVVDNGSSDGTEGYLRDAHPWVKALVYPKGLGFAKSNNQARSVARGEVVCFINNDTAVEPEWLLRPLEILRVDPRVVAVGAKLVYMHDFVRVRFQVDRGAVLVDGRVFGTPFDSKVRWSCGGTGVLRGMHGFWMRDGDRLYVPRPIPGLDPLPLPAPVLRCIGGQGLAPGRSISVWAGDREQPLVLGQAPGIVPLPPLESLSTVQLIQNAGSFLNERGEGGDAGAGEEDDGTRYTAEEIVPTLCGGALFVRREDLDRIGWFPESYKVYYEDTDMCLQLRRDGKLLVFCPSSRIRHYHTGTNREWSPFFIENVTRSSAIFAVRHAPAEIARTRVKQVCVDALKDVRHAVKNRLTPNRAWAELPRLRGVVRAVPGLVDAANRRMRERRPTVFALPRQPYTPAS